MLLAALSHFCLFINSAMTKATQRFLNVELGKGNHDRVSRVYSMSLLIHFAIAVFIGFVLETVGLYFFETKLNIPPETQDAARVVYHIFCSDRLSSFYQGFLMSRALLHMRGCSFSLMSASLR